MPENRQFQRNGGVSNSSDDTIEEAVQRLEIKASYDQEGDVAVDNSCFYPDRPGEPDCIHYLRTGKCRYGSKCKFNHPVSDLQSGQNGGELPERAGQPDCGYYMRTGNCKYGSTCKYNHPKDRHGGGAVRLNSLGLPMRQEEKPCPFYMKTGSCKFGGGCKFDHPQPTAGGTFLPVPGPVAYGSSGPMIMPPSGMHFMQGVSTFSLPRAPYLSGPPVQGSQPYMPYVMSPSQGIAPAHFWNTYVGSMSPITSNGVQGSDFVFNTKNQSETASNGVVNFLTNSIALLPERPDQPECRHFMNTGSCKYGSDCKYHHPRERIVQSPTNSLGPLGLPLRPGQAICSHYSSYGLCKYGPTCKFDHPLGGYSYNYGLNFPPLSIFDSSPFTYQRNSPTVLFSETSPPKSAINPDLAKKLEPACNRSSNLSTKTTEDSSEEIASPRAMSAPLKLQHDRSD
ncbi:hypothetical protein NMG60_11035358 [Bertholletia excelsa]